MTALARRIIYSGIQPSGRLHLGNYFGAITEWVKMQQTSPDADIVFSIVDLHSLTSALDTAGHSDVPSVHDSAVEATACLLASGICPRQSIIYRQSAVPAHTELMWMLSCITPMGWLQKEDEHSLLKLNYHFITPKRELTCSATDVPVGEDQVQHLELARKIVARTNNLLAESFFPIPQTMHSDTPRIMSLTDASQKMSKSNGPSRSRIHVDDTDEEIRSKISKAKTDAIKEIRFDPQNRPEMSNLLQMFAALEGCSVDTVEEKCSREQLSTKHFKSELADLLVQRLSPIRNKMKEFMTSGQAEDVLQDGAKRANVRAEQLMQQMRKRIHLS